jgi:pimeloyl-ACP methyl ester carboxylesterase
MGPNAESDVVQIIKELRQHQGARRVILCGASMGGSACLTFGVRHPELVDGVASMNGTANFIEFEGFQEAIQESFGGAKDQVPIEYRARSAEFYPEKLTMPVGITAGGKDELVPAQSVVRLAKNLAGMGRDVLLLYREEGGHSTSYEDASELLEFVIKEAAPLPGAFP